MMDILTNEHDGILVFCITDEAFGANSYCISCGKHAFIVDPILTSAYEEIISNYIIDMAILTHEHYDHICGVNSLKHKYDVSIVCGEKAKQGLSDPSINMSRYIDFLITAIRFGNHDKTAEEYRCCADHVVLDGESFEWQGHYIKIKETPGHSKGSIAIIVDDAFMFSGDTVFKDYPTATRMPGGSTLLYSQVTKPWLAFLPQEMTVYPGHAKPFILKDRYTDI